VPSRISRHLIPVLIPALLAGCVHVKMDPVKIDATITVRVQRDLEDYFDDIDAASETTRNPDAATGEDPR
jgi:hypothetical protein